MTEVFTVDEEVRAKAHEALDRWLSQCALEAARAFEYGRSGYVGCLKLQATLEEDDLALHCEFSYLEELA